MSVSYEWCREYVDQYDDIQDHDHSDKLSEILETRTVRDAVLSRVTLMRNQGNEEDGLLERGYVYPMDGVMPSEFDCGHKVPAKYHKEWNNFKDNIDS
jgi:hypothetical protein